MIVKTIVEENAQLYSSFPTMTTFNDTLCIFYRQGINDKYNPHGFYGKVKSIKIPIDYLEEFFSNNTLFKIEEKVVFDSENELDAIVSKIDDKLYALASRIFIKNKVNQPFLSFSDTCEFNDRVPVNIKNVNLAAFYGKALKYSNEYVFPAYGSIHNENFTRPLLIVSDDCKRFDLLSYLPSNLDLMLNESSIVKLYNSYIAFSRKDIYQNYAIYYSTSENLIDWSKIQKLLDFALAPMAIVVNETIYVSFRDIENTNKISIVNAKTHEKKVIDTYIGSMFDGGYTDLAYINNYIYVIYYTNNKAPFIKMARLEAF